MSRQASAPHEYHRGMPVDQFENNSNMRQEFGGTLLNPHLPPIRRINNHLPPRSFRSAPITQMDVKYTNSPNVFANKKALARQSDAESVMNFSHSESESDDGSYSDDDSAEQTAYTYADDEHATTNFNCMNPFFIPTANHHDGNDDAALIRCHRVGPSSAEVQLNIPLPSRYMNHLSTVDEGGRRGYMDTVCRAPGLNYNPSQYDPALVDEEVVEVDPYKQFRERIAPQFYESLIEELSDEDVDSDDDEDASEHQRDDSQIFGYLDAHRTAMQQALYNEIVLQQGYVGPSHLQSPPSQIYVTDSGSVLTPEEEPQVGRSMIELKLGASSDVFSRPNDSNEILLNQHLRESAETGNVTVSKWKNIHGTTNVSDHSLELSKYNSPTPAHERTEAVVESAPSLDESSNQSHLSSSAAQDEAIVQIAELKSMSEASGASSSGVDKYAVIDREQTNEEILGPNGRSKHRISRIRGVEQVTKSEVSDSRLRNLKLTILPSFDEPGQITAKKHSDGSVSAPQQTDIEPTHSEAVEPPALPVNSEVKLEPSTYANKVKATWDETDGPDDERSRVVQPYEGIGPSLTFLEAITVNENDSPADENVVSFNRNWNIPKVSKPVVIQKAESSDGSVWSQEATVVVKNEDSQKNEFDVEEPGVIVRGRSTTPTFEKHHRGQGKSPKPLDDIPLKTSMVRRFVNRPILEETSKANVRTEIYDTSTASETTEKASRELRKDRIRSFEPARSSVPVLPAAPIATLPEPNHTTDGSDTSTENPADARSHRPGSKEIPDLDELMEFHSCDEDFFTSHTDSKPFLTGFA